MEKWLSNSFKSLTEEDEFTDCCIKVESKIFRCHKVIMGVASDFFKRSFLSGFKESSTGQMVLKNIKADTFEKFRLYAYTYNNKTLDSYSNEDVIGLMQCASMWMVEPLKEACNEIFKKRLPQLAFTDLLLYFEFAQHVKDTNLIHVTATYMNHQYVAPRVLPVEVYQLGLDVFKEFVNVMKTMKEITRYKLVEKYVTIQGFDFNTVEVQKWKFNGLCSKCDKRESDGYANPNPFKIEDLNRHSEADGLSLSPRPKTIDLEYVKSLLGLINFKKMSAHEFYDGPGKSKLMTFEEKFNLLYAICDKSTGF